MASTLPLNASRMHDHRYHFFRINRHALLDPLSVVRVVLRPALSSVCAALTDLD